MSRSCSKKTRFFGKPEKPAGWGTTTKAQPKPSSIARGSRKPPKKVSGQGFSCCKYCNNCRRREDVPDGLLLPRRHPGRRVPSELATGHSSSRGSGSLSSSASRTPSGRTTSRRWPGGWRRGNQAMGRASCHFAEVSKMAVHLGRERKNAPTSKGEGVPTYPPNVSARPRVPLAPGLRSLCRRRRAAADSDASR